MRRSALAIAKWIATAAGIAGAVLVALNVGLVAYGFALFLASSLLWCAIAVVHREPSLGVPAGRSSPSTCSACGVGSGADGMLMRDLLFALCLLLSGAAAAEPRQVVGVASVIDGDTIEIHGERIRLFGIDAPESRQECLRGDGVRWRCGQQAALALQDHIGRRTVMCVQDDADRYGRSVCHCDVSGEDIGGWLVSHGWAVAYLRYSHRYVADENAARKAHLGIWSGEFMMPWDWRRLDRKGE